LKYNPAPFYIFDEVDAALDLSHTDNIAEVIVRNFPNSQFLVISLKEEFYRKADVLFKTNLVEGQSKIIRIANNKKMF
jgi:structural maintenance of chromosome 2